ncbi:MAG TPA: preprotein translocase subunit YajC [Acidimicrobiales bacterium]|nr:preprotein translocase subunit YajC [Acidimicrobiales bacterium]
MPFHFVNALAALNVLAATKKTSSNPTFLILIVVLIGAYLLFFRPRQQRLRQQQAKQREVEVGDEVVLTSGIIGRVQGFNGDRIEVEIAPGTTIEIVKQGIGRRIDPATSEEQPSDATGAASQWNVPEHPAAEEGHEGSAEHPENGAGGEAGSGWARPWGEQPGEGNASAGGTS